MSIQERLQADMKEAMRARDRLRLDVIRSARDALQKAQLEIVRQNYEDSTRAGQTAPDTNPREIVLDDETQESVITREIKRRREAAEMYRKAGQTERAEDEEAEARILADYLPQQLGAEELRPQIAAIIKNHGFSGAADMSKLMPVLMQQFKGRTQGRLLSQLARELLSET